MAEEIEDFFNNFISDEVQSSSSVSLSSNQLICYQAEYAPNELLNNSNVGTQNAVVVYSLTSGSKVNYFATQSQEQNMAIYHYINPTNTTTLTNVEPASYDQQIVR